MKTLAMDSGRRGSGMVAVMIVIMAVSAYLGIIVSASRQQGHMSRVLGDRVRAIAAAEAGGNVAYSILATNFMQWSNAAAFPTTYYDGSNVVWKTGIRPSSNPKIVSVYCTGYCGIAETAIAFDVKRRYLDSEVFDYSLVVGGGGGWGGNGTLVISGAAIHVNGELDMNGNCNITSIHAGADMFVGDMNVVGGSSKIWADITTDGELTGKGYKGANVTGTVEDIVIPTPEDMNWDSYYNEALAHGQVVSAGGGQYQPTDAELAALSANGGILYVIGNVKINNSAAFTGTIIATGNIDVSGQADVTEYTSPDGGTYPVFMAKGDINITGGGDITGLIYSPNYINASGGGDIQGTIIAGTFNKGGGWDMLAYEDSIPTPPEEPNSQITAWHE